VNDCKGGILVGSEEISLEVSVKYKDMEVKFTGSPGDVVRSLLGFMRQVIPEYEIVEGLSLTVDLKELLKKVKGLIAFTPEGIVITVPRERLGGEKNIILLHLMKAYVGYSTGRLKKDLLKTGEIVSLTGGKTGTVGARLSELTSMGWIERKGRGEYRITTLGIKALIDEILPTINKGS
jgi:hypothetical protein